MRVDKVMIYLSDIDKVRKFISEAIILCDGVLKRQKDFSILQVQKALETLEQLVECGEYFSDKDTAYYACILWTHQDLKILDNQEQRTEYDFGDWYIREAAKLQGITIQVTMKIPKELLEEKDIVIQTKEDFVKFISYQYDYIKYETTEDKELLVYVFDSKDGASCPDCGQFSNHVKLECGYGCESMGKLNGWTIEFQVNQNSYYCDNPKCQTEWFFGRDKVLYVERHAHFAKLKKMSGMPKKICALFGIK